MYSLYLKGFFRRMLKSKSYFLINISGLSIAISCSILILLWVKYECSFDKFYKNTKNIYRVYPNISINGNNFTSSMAPPPLAEVLKSQFPEVIETTRIWTYDNNTVSNEEGGRADKVFNEKHLYQADSSFFKIFDIKTLQGDPKKILTLPFTVAITKETAIKYFSREEYEHNAILGKTLMLTFGGKENAYKITAITEDIPSNAHFHYNIIFSNNYDSWSKSTNWVDNTYYTYVLLRTGTNPSVLESKLPSIIRTYLDPQLRANFGTSYDELKNKGDFWEFKLLPLTDIHLRSNFDREIEPTGDSNSVTILSAVSILLILMACINYANLSTAYFITRSGEIGIRKTLGSTITKLRWLIFSESAVLTAIAWLLALILIIICIRPFSNLMDIHFPDKILENAVTWSIFISIFLIVSILGGIYPAFYLSSVDAIKAVKGKITSGKRSILVKSALVIGQFTISIGLAISAILVYQQLHLLREKSPGFNKENIIVIANPSGKLYGKEAVFFNELKSQPGVISASTCSDYPGNGSHNFPIAASLQNENVDHLVTNFTVGYDFLQTFGISLAQGRDFSRDLDKAGDRRIILNEAAVREIHLKNPVNTYIDTKYLNTLNIEPVSYKIIGIMRDFNFQSFHHVIRPVAIFLGESDEYVCIRIRAGNIENTVNRLRNTWKSILPGTPFEFNFVDEKINNLYRSEISLGRLLIILTALIIFIAAIGLYGITQLMLQQRTKEIGIRKVLGAGFSDILFQLNKQFIKWIFISLVIAFPLSILIMNKWLQDFAYRIRIPLRLFIVIALVTVLVTFLITGYRSIKAAMQSPVKTLRNE
jgi:putative ABC transport system permease protein